MLVTNHVLTGALIGAAARRGERPRPRGVAAAFAAGVASHFVLDSLPHWGDPEDFLPVAVRDGIVGLVAMGSMTALAPRRMRAQVLAAMVGAALPDLDKPGRLFVGRSPFPAVVDRFHVAIQHEAEHRMPQELVVGSLLATTGLAVLGSARRRRRPGLPSS